MLSTRFGRKFQNVIPSRRQIPQAISAILHQELFVPAEYWVNDKRVKIGTRLENDLGMESIDIESMRFKLEKQFNLRLGDLPEKMNKKEVATVKDLIDYIQRNYGKAEESVKPTEVILNYII